MRRITKVGLLLALLLFSLVAVTGCGGGSSSTTTGKVSPAHCPPTAYVTQFGCSAHAPNFGVPKHGVTLPRPSTVSSTQDMYDSVTVSSSLFPPNPFAVAGYTSGLFPTYPGLVRTFPNSKHVSIAISATALPQHVASCLDIEPRDAVPSEAFSWYVFVTHRGIGKPCFYASLSTMAAVRANLSAHGISRVRYWLWDANWTFTHHLDSGYDCTQWTNHYLNRNLDASVCTLSFLGGSSPKPPPKPDPLAYLVKHQFVLARGIKASEYNTVKIKVKNNCKRPYRRKICTSSGYHARLLADRDWFIAHHHIVRGHWVELKHARWTFPDKHQPLGRRFHTLWAIGKPYNPCPKVGSCMP